MQHPLCQQQACTVNAVCTTVQTGLATNRMCMYVQEHMHQWYSQHGDGCIAAAGDALPAVAWVAAKHPVVQGNVGGVQGSLQRQ